MLTYNLYPNDSNEFPYNLKLEFILTFNMFPRLVLRIKILFVNISALDFQFALASYMFLRNLYRNKRQFICFQKPKQDTD